MTVVIRTNVDQLSDVLVKDLGYAIPGAGGQVTLNGALDISNAQNSLDLFGFAGDGSYVGGADPNNNTIVLNDGTSDYAQDELDSFFGVVFTLGEVVLVFTGATTPVASGTAININTGAYSGVGSPATVKGNTNLVLPSAAVDFNNYGSIEVSLNGVELDKGSTGSNGVVWASTTQLQLPIKRIFSGNKLTIKVPI